MMVSEKKCHRNKKTAGGASGCTFSRKESPPAATFCLRAYAIAIPTLIRKTPPAQESSNGRAKKSGRTTETGTD